MITECNRNMCTLKIHSEIYDVIDKKCDIKKLDLFTITKNSFLFLLQSRIKENIQASVSSCSELYISLSLLSPLSAYNATKILSIFFY